MTQQLSQCSASDLGALLRREGLRGPRLSCWRTVAAAALAAQDQSARGRTTPSVEAKRQCTLVAVPVACSHFNDVGQWVKRRGEIHAVRHTAR